MNFAEATTHRLTLQDARDKLIAAHVDVQRLHLDKTIPEPIREVAWGVMCKIDTALSIIPKPGEITPEVSHLREQLRRITALDPSAPIGSPPDPNFFIDQAQGIARAALA